MEPSRLIDWTEPGIYSGSDALIKALATAVQSGLIKDIFQFSTFRGQYESNHPEERSAWWLIVIRTHELLREAREQTNDENSPEVQTMLTVKRIILGNGGV